MSFECKPDLPQDDVKLGIRLFERVGVLDTLNHIRHGAESAKLGHRRLSRLDRAAAMGFDLGTHHSRQIEADFSAARGHARAARNALLALAASEQFLKDVGEISQLIDSDDFRNALDEAKFRFEDYLLESTYRSEEIKEVIDIWDETGERLKRNGIMELTASITNELSELERVLTAGENWGRNPRSPMGWYVYATVAGLIGISILAVIFCVAFFACSYLFPLIATAWVGLSFLG